jgi:hypothetical protein
MTLAQGSAVVAIVSAVVAAAVAILGVFERGRAFRAQQAELKQQADHWHAEFRKDFWLEQYRYRLAAYPEVFKTLGAVPDVTSESGPDKYKALYGRKAMLRETAEALRGHLYGQPGLLMEMPTRNSLHAAWRQCLLFANGDGDEQAGDLLVDLFFHARRYLRADLDLVDNRTAEKVESRVKKLDPSEGSVS